MNDTKLRLYGSSVQPTDSTTHRLFDLLLSQCICIVSVMTFYGIWILQDLWFEDNPVEEDPKSLLHSMVKSALFFQFLEQITRSLIHFRPLLLP